MTMSKGKNYIKLEYKGSLLFEAYSSELVEPISIGRAHDCQWRIPEIDQYASAHHAILKAVKGGFELEDQHSTNGTYSGGKKIHKIVLTPGMTAVLGDSVISVETVKENASSEQLQFHSLECLNGEDKGKILSLSKKDFFIGTDEGCQYVCKSNLISKRHALLRTDSRGECWLIDNESKNGVSVNKVVMPPNKERLLKDGDIISIAVLDFRFLDKNKKHVRSYWGLKLAAVFLTLGLAAFTYIFYLSSSANAYDLIQRSRQFAAAKNFAGALAVLDEAANAREYAKFEQEVTELRSQIRTWSMTDREWSNVVKMAGDRNWAGAVMTLGSMQCDKLESWNWNEEDASVAKNKAVALKHYIDVYLRSKGVFSNSNSSVEDIANAASLLKEALSTTDEFKKDELFVPLFGEMRKLVSDIDRNLANHAKLTEILRPLNERAPDFSKIVSELSALEADSVGVIKQTAGTYLKVIKKLSKAQNILLENALLLTEFDFHKIKLRLDLPTMDECAVHSQISSSRAMLETIHSNFIFAYKQILHIRNKFKTAGIRPPESHPLIAEFVDEDVIASLVQCDALKKKIPNRTRKEPFGLYDKMLGIEYFYEVLKALPEKYDNMVLERINFTPDCVEAKSMLELFENYKQFVEQPENRWLMRGKVREWHDYCAGQLIRRDKVVIQWIEKSSASESREAILYMGLAFYFAADKSVSHAKREQFAADFKKYREPVAKLDTEYESASPERAIEIREEILKIGIPGDPLVRRVWATKY